MKTIIRLLNPGSGKLLLALTCLILAGISCSKDKSANPPDPPPNTKSVSLFTTQIPSGVTGNDSLGGIELGVKFRTTVAGKITGIKFYKTSGNTGTHTGQLYSSTGSLLASQQFTSETDSGWQTAMFTTPVDITANTTYIAAYHSSLGNYVSTPLGLQTAITNDPLTALADSTDGINGLYKYTNDPALPDTGYQSSNYWVDVIEKINL